MNVDHILATLNQHGVEYLLIGGMNFLLRHQPLLTFDVDVWVQDTPANLACAERALAALEAEWGATETSWQPVATLSPGWLRHQAVYCLTSRHGAIDIFLAVRGLADWTACAHRAPAEQTGAGTAYRGLSDADMLQCQLALEEGIRKQDRIRVLTAALEQGPTHG